MTDINIASVSASLYKCCDVVGINASTYFRWHQDGQVIDDKRPTAQRPVPQNKLSADEEKAILSVCCQEEYADLRH
ncbi:MAG: hypothetical protein HRT38_08885 [Alteromonadaceae bacterium]|nr:hypothetical protein [Alteromonadaceae bacterium]